MEGENGFGDGANLFTGGLSQIKLDFLLFWQTSFSIKSGLVASAHKLKFMTKLLIRWTVGNTSKAGYACLRYSISKLQQLYSAQYVLCYNCDYKIIVNNGYTEFPNLVLHDQSQYLNCTPAPTGVAWKLYPPRLDPEAYELSVDSDLVIEQHIPQIDKFLNSDSTLLLEGDSRTYGRFDRHVPPQHCINSGVYGMPPRFDLEKYIRFYAGDTWEKNALGQHDKNETFDEQGLIALALLDHKNTLIIPQSTISNCEHTYQESHGMHFIGLNRRQVHDPFKIYQSKRSKLFL